MVLRWVYIYYCEFVAITVQYFSWNWKLVIFVYFITFRLCVTDFQIMCDICRVSHNVKGFEMCSEWNALYWCVFYHKRPQLNDRTKRYTIETEKKIKFKCENERVEYLENIHIIICMMTKAGRSKKITTSVHRPTGELFALRANERQPWSV